MKIRALLTLPVAAFVVAAILAPAAGAATAKPCSSSSLVIWAGPEPGGGTAGGFEYEIEFTNLGAKACTVSGSPSVSAVNLRGGKIGAATSPVAGKKAAVKLAPGQSTSATLLIADALNFPKARCSPTMAAGLRIGVPGGSGSKIAPLAFETCAKPSAATMTVGAVTSMVTVF